MLKTSIPYVDLRGKTAMDLLRIYPDKARGLIAAATGTFGLASKLLSPLALLVSDYGSHRWLKQNRNPYLHEIESCADILGGQGVYTLNLSYEWGCTSGAYRQDDTMAMLRVLDWPFPELGKSVLVVLQSGKAGEYYNITWPGLVGVFTAMAPGRFSAAINIAPMRRHGRGMIIDWVINRKIAREQKGLPPSHLLKFVMENARSYDEAKQLLLTTRLAVPAIFTLTGITYGQGCIIERLEDSGEVLEISAAPQIATSNHFVGSFSAGGKGWWPRAFDSHGRYQQSCALHGHDLDATNFDWLRAPIINPFTRLAVVANAATGRLMVQGYEGSTQATHVYELPKVRYEKVS